MQQARVCAYAVRSPGMAPTQIFLLTDRLLRERIRKSRSNQELHTFEEWDSGWDDMEERCGVFRPACPAMNVKQSGATAAWCSMHAGWFACHRNMHAPPKTRRGGQPEQQTRGQAALGPACLDGLHLVGSRFLLPAHTAPCCCSCRVMTAHAAACCCSCRLLPSFARLALFPCLQQPHAAFLRLSLSPRALTLRPCAPCRCTPNNDRNPKT